MRAAIARRGSFNLIHLASGFKVDCFQKADGPFDAAELARSVTVRLTDEPREIRAKSAEDTLLRKLLWYRQDGEVSTTQWQDVQGLVRTQADRLDRTYLDRWAKELEIEELLARALALSSKA